MWHVCRNDISNRTTDRFSNFVPDSTPLFVPYRVSDGISVVESVTNPDSVSNPTPYSKPNIRSFRVANASAHTISNARAFCCPHGGTDFAPDTSPVFESHGSPNDCADLRSKCSPL